jgi:glycogen debranching enzyme
VALFGRDTLTTAWQSALLGPEMIRGTLLELAQWIGRDDDPWRDEQPGKLLHEAHTGPTSMLGLNPRQRYYGSITTSGFYPVVLAELWRWTGERETVEALLPTALGALEWLDRETIRSDDGFYGYLTRSRDGVKHQAWKDSRDAMVDAEGHEVEPPIATCEEQAFVYVAKLHLAEVCWWLDHTDIARRLWRDAHDLKQRFNDRFWMQPEGFYAMGLDGDGRPIRSISSNPGHCLAAGIVDSERAGVTADRLMAPDLFSGWGIRTLSAQHPAYNPYSYHRGSVWPVEQGSFAIGFLRYGLHDHLCRLGRAVFDAAALFEHERLPELFAGHARTADQPFPALYPQGNSPQAWSASALFLIVQALLGLYPYAPLRTLLLDPHLPEWLPR